MRANYDKVAKFYDSLALLVFGSSLEKAKMCKLHYIKPHNKVLIIGGGTGSILNYLKNYNITIDFVEISAKMIGRATERAEQNMEIQFYNEDIFYFTKKNYDVVICNFFVDQFSQDKAEALVSLIYDKLKAEGILLVSDFIYSNKIKHRFLVKSMYLFFAIASNLKKVILSDFKVLFIRRYFLTVSSTFVRDNIRSDVYKKCVIIH